MTRVLHVVTLGPNDGLGVPGPLRVALSLVDATAAQRPSWQSEVWTTSRSADRSTQLPGVRIFAARQLTRRTLASIVSLGLLVRLVVERRRFDLVHLHLGRDLVMIPAAVILRLLGVPYVTQTHGMVEPGGAMARRAFDRLITRPTIVGAHANLALQETEASWLARLGARRGHVVVVPNIADVTGLPASSSRSPAAGAVLFLAHLRPRKRVIDFYDAAVALRSDLPDTRFVIVGPDGGDLPALERRMRENPDPRIVYLGAVPADEARQLTASALVYCLPAVNEPFPISVLDAWALGTPVVMTSECHIASLTREFGAGVVVPPGVAGLADGIRSLVVDQVSRERCTEGAARLLRDRLTSRSVGGMLLDVYDQANTKAST